MMIVTLVKEVSDVDGVVIALNAILAMVCIAALFIVWWLIKRIKEVTAMPDITKADLKSLTKRKDEFIQEGCNQVLYLMLCIGDENVAHDNWHPERAQILYETRKEIVQMFKSPRPDGVMNTAWPHFKEDGTRDWPDFEKYTYCPG